MIHTIMFVEKEEDKGQMVIGYHLNSKNYKKSPNGIIRIARFSSNFYPQLNRGYYGDIYMNILVKNWRKKHIEKKKRDEEILLAIDMLIKKNICDDLIMEITKYI